MSDLLIFDGEQDLYAHDQTQSLLLPVAPNTIDLSTVQTPEYDVLAEREHILQRPDMFFGSTRFYNGTEYIARRQIDPTTGQEIVSIFTEQGRYNRGLVHLFQEIFSNALDNVWRSSQARIPASRIVIVAGKEAFNSLSASLMIYLILIGFISCSVCRLNVNIR